MNRRTRELVKQHAASVQEQILDCGCTQPVAEGETLWMFSRRTQVDCLMSECNVPEELFDAVAAKLACPECGQAFNLYSDVTVEPDEVYRHREMLREAEEKHSRDLHDFARHLQERKGCRGLHPIGRALLRQVGEFPRGIIKETRWVRARPQSAGASLKVDEMRAPSADLVKEAGRHNHAGESQWYLAQSADAAAAEVAVDGDEFVWIQEFKVEELGNVLDLRAWTADDSRAEDNAPPRDGNTSLLAVATIFGDHLTGKEDNEGDDREPHYGIPRFVADAAKRKGFSAIRYRSPRHLGENLVVFDGGLRLEAVGVPRRMVLSPEFFERRKSRFTFRGVPVEIPSWPHRAH